jgi:hypothetical protein
MFWIAIASVKSAAVIARSCVTGVKNNPKLWRMPMPRASNTAVPSNIRRVWLPLEENVRDIQRILRASNTEARGNVRQASSAMSRAPPVPIEEARGVMPALGQQLRPERN